MTPSECIAGIESVLKKATPYPWADLTVTFSEGCKAASGKRGQPWHAGKRGDKYGGDRAIHLIAHAKHHGNFIKAGDVPRLVDYWDLQKVASLRQKDTPRGGIGKGEWIIPDDRSAIVMGRNAMPLLIALLREIDARRNSVSASDLAAETDAQMETLAPYLTPSKDKV